MVKFFKKYSSVLAVLSEKKDGSMRFLSPEKSDGKNRKNRKKYLKKIGIKSPRVVAAGLEHGTRIVLVRDSRNKLISGADGLVTDQKGLFLSLTVADCFPVYFYEKKKKIIALSHAGWRGIRGGIIPNTLKTIRELGGRAENLVVAIGPGICRRHFQIGEEIVNEFRNYPDFVFKKDSKIFVDLRGILKKQLIQGKVKPENIEIDPRCTFSEKRFFSFRRDRLNQVETMIAVIGFKK